jgi:hypothetical protein
VLSLSELQAAFAADLLDRGAPSRLAQWIEGDAARRLAIYRNNVFGNYRKTLREVYPVVLRLVGEGFFRQASDAYVGECPSRSGDLNDFGEQFPQFFADYAPAAELVYLADVARLEWAVERVFSAADVPALAPVELAAFAPERWTDLRLKLHPAARVVASDYPIARIWEVNQPGFSGEDRVSLDDGAERVLVRRRDFTVEVVRLADDESVWLSALQRGATLGEAYAETARTNEQFDLGQCLQRHILGGSFAESGLDEKEER